MRIPTLLVVLGAACAGAAAWPSPANARSQYFSSRCGSCHGSSTASCDGCHYHGTSGLRAAADKATYRPGETISVTISGGDQGGWFGGAVLDASNAVVKSASGSSPITVTAPAPTSPGTYTWKGAWYGHGYDSGGRIGGSGYLADSARASHGWQPVSFSFTVSGSTGGPTASLSPTSLDFGSVAAGHSTSLTATLSNTGSASLSVSSVTSCSNTAPPFSVSPSTAFAVAAGASQTLTLTYAPSSTGTTNGCFKLATNDASHATITLNVTGTSHSGGSSSGGTSGGGSSSGGTSGGGSSNGGSLDPTGTGSEVKGGCSSAGASTGALGLLALALARLRRSGRRDLNGEAR